MAKAEKAAATPEVVVEQKPEITTPEVVVEPSVEETVNDKDVDGGPVETAETTPEVSTDFVNPFNEGVTYSDFLAAIPEGVTVQEYCAGKLSEEEVAWLEIELEHFNNNKK